MKFRVPLFALAVAVLATGCKDTQSTAPRPHPGDPSKMIFDGAHHGGNPDFFFLPLLGPEARNSPNYDPGKFNAKLTPVVKICKLVLPVTGATTRLISDVPRSLCGPLIATISDVAVFPSLEFYLAAWKTRNYNLDPDAFYRVQVFVGSTNLGFVDVTVVTSLREAKNAITGEVVPLADDLTLPIPFRIEAGALTGGASSACKGPTPDCVEVSVKKVGGTFFTNTKWAGIQLESGWASDEAFALGGGSIQLTIERVRSRDGNCHGGSDGEPGEAPALGRLFAELDGCYHYATDPALDDPRIPEAKRGFQTDNNKVGQCTRELPTDEGAADADYLLFKSDPGKRIKALRDVPAPLGLDCANFAFYQALPDNPVLRLASIKLREATQAISHFIVNEAYAWDGGLGGLLEKSDVLSHISRGVGLRAARTSTDNQSAPVGTSVSVRVRVTTEHLHAGEESREPKAGVPVTFMVPDGVSGDLGDGAHDYTGTTDENGEIVVSWYLAVGTHTIYASALTIDPTRISFTATGIANGAAGGTIFSSGAIPVSGASVTLRELGRGVITNSLGQYSFTNVPAGTYTIGVSGDGFLPTARSIDVGPGGTVTTNVTLVRPADFTITSMTVSPATPTSAGAASYVVVISNIGETDAPASEGTFIEGWSPPPTDPPGAGGTSPNPVSVPAIPVGGSVTVTVPAILSLGAGTYSGSFTANTGDPRVIEFSNGNNSRSASYTIPPVVIGFRSAPVTNSASVAIGLPWLSGLGSRTGSE